MTSSYCDSPLHQEEAGDASGHQEASGKQQRSADVSELYSTHRQDLLLHLQSMVKDRDIAEELLHDTFIRVSRMPAISAIRKPRPFLIKTARNLALDYLRQQKARPAADMEDIDTELMAADPEHLEQLIKERRLQQLKSAVAGLPPRAREALMLAKYREMPLKEVAREMEISQTMVEKHLKTALQKCRTALISESH